MTLAKRILYSLLLLIFLAACDRAKGAPPERIRVGSYNMRILSQAKESKSGSLAAMAKIASAFDLLAMQEVGSNGSTASDESCDEVMDAFVAATDEAAGGPYYSFVRGDQLAFLYRKDRLEAASSALYRGDLRFTYPPLAAYFRVIGRPLDFTAITVHTRPSLAVAEIPEIAALMDEEAVALGDPDVVCLGDFNAGGEYYTEGSGLDLAGFPASRFVTVIPNGADTTVGKKALAYDRIELSSAMADDYAGTWGVVHPEDPSLSDHYPVWAELMVKVRD